MFTINEVAAFLGLNPHKLRYWIKKNNTEVKKELYDFSLTNLLQKLFTNKNGRLYKCYFILDMDEFQNAYNKYMEHVIFSKQKKRSNNLSWTQSAIDCYRCNMECKKCMNFEICQKVSCTEIEPPMKETVQKLLKIIGKPQI